MQDQKYSRVYRSFTSLSHYARVFQGENNRMTRRPLFNDGSRKNHTLLTLCKIV